MPQPPGASRDPLDLWALIGLSAAVWITGALCAWRGLLAVDCPLWLWLLVPLATLALLGWAPTHWALRQTHAKVGSELGDPPVPAFHLPWEPWAAQGLGAGLSLLAAWVAFQSFVAADTPRLLGSAAVVALGIGAVVVGRRRLAEAQRLHAGPWQTLLRLRGLRAPEDPRPIGAHFETLRHAAAGALSREHSRALQAHARPIFQDLRQRLVAHLEGLMAHGRGDRALEVVETWRRRAHECATLYAFLGLTKESLDHLHRRLTEGNSRYLADRRALIEPLIEEAAALLDKGQPSQALAKIDEAQLHLPREENPQVGDLRQRLTRLHEHARQLLAAAQRNALASEAPEVRRQGQERMREAFARAREAIAQARQHIAHGDPVSAAGSLTEAVHHALTIPHPEVAPLRGEIEALRVQCLIRPGHCPNCRVLLSPQGHFCSQCGTPVQLVSTVPGFPTPAPVMMVPMAGSPGAFLVPVPTQAAAQPTPAWQDIVLIVAGALSCISLFLPWQRGLPGVGGAPPGWFLLVATFKLSEGLGLSGSAILLWLEAAPFVLLFSFGTSSIIWGLLHRTSSAFRSRWSRSDYSSLRWGLGISWLLLGFFAVRLLTDSSIFGGLMLMGGSGLASLLDSLMGGQGGGNMFVEVAANSGVGLWMLLGASVALGIAAFSREME